PDALPGKADQVYQKRSGFCLETQNFPDSPNKPQFPSPVLRPGQHYSQKTLFRFGIE
ncbi:MAG: galactose-1-epimerase, partial [SAR324 cluster bacterium]|nr:galactose-1-epimerase [SAR324 cluster bacterium]